ncbi:Alpha-1 3(6)-mannosylglycoprotein beta-1 6-N-acetyl-glucosaminyltransferase [Fasciola hepatica]|uniref:alpha-1,6-mannosyl-glycoprotein 6-beta-N-acetylglucosaminyltransferase n=1 Tax=Fasciola hepatica TaxID=6192 RepID=A0A4E0R5L7_FASHE|nr:Alpha-1 3(6)-mannosylglycoprotein beta-1 6-N-acetyl-glucosaminyltransferase [Fasciola hepatica]
MIALPDTELRANILRLSADYVRLLAREQQDTADGPYRSLGTNYDMKKTMAVLLNEMNIRVEQLDAQVKELSARVTGSGTESRSLSPSQSQRRLHQIGGVTEGIVDFVSLLRGVQEGCVVDAQKLLSFPECESKIKWLRARWRSDPCYAELGVDGTDCSLVRYLSEVENFCPFTEDKLKYSSRPFAQITYDLTGLLTGLSPEEKHDLSYRFIRSRLTRMWPQWVDGMRRYASWNGVNDNDTIESQQRHTAPTEPDFSYQPGAEPPGQPHFFNRTRLNIHLHLSFISLSSSALFEQSVGKGMSVGA